MYKKAQPFLFAATGVTDKEFSDVTRSQTYKRRSNAFVA
jgi:hypothetical protein